MKKSKRILGILFFALLGTIFSLAIGIMPLIGAIGLSFAAFIPMPNGVLGQNAFNTQEEISQEEKLLLKFDDKLKKAKKDFQLGLINEDGLNLRLEEINKNIPADIGEYKENFDKLKEYTEKLSGELEIVKDNKSSIIPQGKENAIKKAINEIVETEEFKNWVDNGFKGEAPKVTVKYDITNDRTGNDTITTQSGFVRETQTRSIHMRDLFTVLPTDLPYFVFDKVTSWTNAADVNTENGTAGEIDMTTAEETVDVKRLAGFMDISKRAMKSVVWLKAFLNKHLPEKIKNIEDFQILFGDGSGNNLSGISENAQTFDLTGVSYSTGDINAVSSYDGGTKTLVTFNNGHGLTNGYKITFAHATHAGYNATFTVQVKSPTVIMIDKSYIAEADTSAWTGTTAYWLADEVDNAQEADVLMAVRSFLANGEYQITGHAINPADTGKIELFKSTTNEYIASKKIERISGVLYVGGLPVVETNAIPPGKFISGDFRMAAELLQFTQLTLSFHSDTTYAKNNKVMALIEEEILFPILNPYMFVYGDFATAITALETP